MGAECEKCGMDIWDECYSCDKIEKLEQENKQLKEFNLRLITEKTKISHEKYEQLKELLKEACDYFDRSLSKEIGEHRVIYDEIDGFLNKPEIKELINPNGE